MATSTEATSVKYVSGTKIPTGSSCKSEHANVHNPSTNISIDLYLFILSIFKISN